MSGPDKEKFLITGGQGCIGAWILRHLLDEGVEATVIDLKPNDHILQQILRRDEINALDRMYGDVADLEFVEKAVTESGASDIIHLAGLQIPTCRENPQLGATVNVIGTINVLQAARASGGRIRNVVYASSAAVFGPPGDYAAPIDDDTPHQPHTHYGYFKLANEGNARIYWQDHKVPSVGLRPYAVFGVGREIGISSGPSMAIRAAAAGQDFAIPFSGLCGFNYVSDIARQFIGCAQSRVQGALALNTRGDVVDVETFVECIVRAVPEAADSIRCSGDPLPVAADVGQPGLEALLGNVPHTPLADAIRDTALHYRRLFDDGTLEP